MTHFITVLWRFALVLALGSTIPHLAVASDFPQKPIKIVVGFAPGGGTDTLTRELARRMGAKLGQTVVVDNKPGGGQVLAMQTAMGSPPDGYTLVIGSPGAFSVSPHLYKNLQYDSRKFVTVAPISAQAIVLAALPDFPASSFTELIKLAKSQKTGLNYGSFGVGTSAHLGMEMLKKSSGLEAMHIAYRGDPPALMALKSKEVHVAGLTMFSALARIKSGEIKALGVFQAKPDRNLPQVQTTSQAGFPDVDLPSWLGLFAPPNTPKEIVDKLEAAAREAVASREFQAYALNSGSEPLSMSNKDFRAMIDQQSARLGTIIKAINLQPE
jgi:putative tricarboxylic transport membrane protein